MQEKQFDDKISQWSKIVNKIPTVYPQIQQAKQQIQDFINEHQNPSQPPVPKLSAQQLQRVKNLKQFVNGEIRKHSDFKYYFNPTTKILCQNIGNKKKQNELYINRFLVIQIFEEITNSPQVSDKYDKLHKLQKLLAQADRRIQKKESMHIKPLSLSGKAKQAYTEYIREINFFLIVAWIISFLLANKDPSTCLNAPIVGVMSFRHWLWANAGITLYLTFMLVFWTITRSDDNQDDSHQQSDDQQQPTMKQKNHNKQGNTQTKMTKKQTQTLNKTKDKNEKGSCGYLLLLFLSIGILGKFFWIFFGIIIFLNGVDFDNCGDNVLNYCSLEFLAFFSFTIYGAITELLLMIKNNSKNPQKSYPSQQELEEKQKKQKSKKPESQEDQLRLSIEGNIDDLQDILKRVVVWNLIGWVYDFVLFRKDHSGCLDEQYDNFSLTYRSWLLIDGITSLVTFVFSILLIIIFIVKRQHLMIWQLKEEFFQVNMNWVANNLFFSILFGLILLFKTVWLIIGVIVLCLNVNLGTCSGNIPNFLVAYFTESVYVIIETTVSVIRGYKKRRSLKLDRENLDESRMNLLQNTEHSSPKKKRKDTETNGSKNLIREENNQMSKIPITPVIRGSEKKLISGN